MNDSIENQMKGKNGSINRLMLAALLGSLAAFGPLSIDMYLPALPHIAEEYHSTQSFVQLSLTFFVAGLALGQLIVGPLSDVKGRRIPLLVGLFVYSIASLLCVFSPSIWAFILLRFIQGFSGAAGIVLSRAIVRDFYSGVEMTKFFSLLALVNGVAPILAPVLGAIILTFAPWKAVFVVLSLIGAVMFLLVLFSLPESLPIQSRQQGGVVRTFKTFKQLFFDPSFIGYALTIAFIFSLLFSYISGSSFVLQDIYGVSPLAYGLIFGANGIGLVIASQVVGRLAGKVSEKKLLLTGIIMAIAGSSLLLLLLFFHASLLFILPPLFVAVSSMGLVGSTGQSLALQSQGKTAGSAAALIGVLQFVIAGIVGPFTGLGDPAISMGLVMALSSIAAFLLYFFIINLVRLKN